MLVVVLQNEVHIMSCTRIFCAYLIIQSRSDCIALSRLQAGVKNMVKKLADTTTNSSIAVACCWLDGEKATGARTKSSTLPISTPPPVKPSAHTAMHAGGSDCANNSREKKKGPLGW